MATRACAPDYLRRFTFRCFAFLLKKKGRTQTTSDLTTIIIEKITTVQEVSGKKKGKFALNPHALNYF